MVCIFGSWLIYLYHMSSWLIYICNTSMCHDVWMSLWLIYICLYICEFVTHMYLKHINVSWCVCLVHDSYVSVYMSSWLICILNTSMCHDVHMSLWLVYICLYMYMFVTHIFLKHINVSWCVCLVRDSCILYYFFNKMICVCMYWYTYMYAYIHVRIFMCSYT